MMRLAGFYAFFVGGIDLLNRGKKRKKDRARHGGVVDVVAGVYAEGVTSRHSLQGRGSRTLGYPASYLETLKGFYHHELPRLI